MLMKTKIIRRGELDRLVSVLKKENKRIVAVSGVFDIIHSGHIYFLEQAKSFGDILIVLLNSDASVKKYKSPERPINDEESRAKVLKGFRAIDFVVIFNETTPVKLLYKIRPKVFCQGDDWGMNCPERAAVEKYGGRLEIIKRLKGFSTSAIIGKIVGK